MFHGYTGSVERLQIFFPEFQLRNLRQKPVIDTNRVSRQAVIDPE